MGEVALAALIVVVCWEGTMGAQVVHILDLLAEQVWSVLIFGLHYLGHKNCPFLLAQNQTQEGMV
jgi:hypothetical protein